MGVERGKRGVLQGKGQGRKRKRKEDGLDEDNDALTTPFPSWSR